MALIGMLHCKTKYIDFELNLKICCNKTILTRLFA